MRRDPASPTEAGQLSVESNFPDPDAAYRLLSQARRGLTIEEASALDSRLVLVLANHIGDMDVLRQAIALAAGEGS